MTTTNSSIRNAWKSLVFKHDDIATITDCIYDRRLDPLSQSELAKMYFNKEINCIEYVVSSTCIPGLCGGFRYVYSIDITITRKADVQGLNFNRVLDTIEKILNLQVTELGTSWNDNIDYYENPANPPIIDYQNVADVPCYRANIQILGFKLI